MNSWPAAGEEPVAEAKLGARGPRASALGLGLAALGRPAYINIDHAEDIGADRSPEALEERTHTMLDVAHSAGIRYFDMARSYGEAERFMGSWLKRRGLAPGEVTVGSKWGYTYTAGWRVQAEVHEVRDLAAENLRRQLVQTRELLGEHLSLYQIHSATLESGVLTDPAVVDQLSALRADGVAIGLSVTGPGQAATVDLAVDVDAFDTVQATWNLLERSAEKSLARAHAAGLGVIIKEPLANGRLVRRSHPRLSALSAEVGAARDRLALSAALAQPWADVVLSGAVTVEQLDGNLAATRTRWTAELDRAPRELAVAPAEYWAERSARPGT